jgi:hypothetical protein
MIVSRFIKEPARNYDQEAESKRSGRNEQERHVSGLADWSTQ